MHSEKMLERTHSVTESIEKGLRGASLLGLETSFTAFGNSLLMYRCDVMDVTGKKNSGKGKGIGSQVVASALFEAIEHYCLSIDVVQTLTKIKLGEHPLDGEIIDGSPSFSSILVKKSPPLSRILFRKLDENEVEIAAPAFLFDPRFEAQSASESEYLRVTGLCRYSTNSGTAAGTTLEDAQLHALMELIERDALSIELLSTIFASKPKPVRRIINESLTDELRELVKLSEDETGGVITIWNITTDTQIPTILVRLANPLEMSQAYFGSGASLYVEYAIERALMEAVQGFHIYTKETSRTHLLLHINKFKYRTPYQRCLLEYGYFDYRGGEQQVPLSILIKEYPIDFALTIKEQIQMAINALKNAEISVYGRVIFSNDVHVAQIYSPSLERFFLASVGVPIVPGKRGLRSLT